MTQTSIATTSTPAATKAVLKPPGQWREALRVFCRNPSAVIGSFLLLAIVCITVFGPMFMEADPFELVGPPMMPPGEGFGMLGTDYLGRDILTGLVYGGRATLLVGVVAAFLAVFIGVLIGALSGYYGGWVDETLM